MARKSKQPDEEPKPVSPEEVARHNLGSVEVEAALADYDGYILAKAAQIWSYQETGHRLTIEEQLFCRSYVIDRNPVAALRRIGYANVANVLKARAKKLLAMPEVQDCVEALSLQMMAALQVTAERVQERIAAIAFFDPRQVLEFDGHRVGLLHSRFWNEGQASTISSIKQGQHGVEIKFYDRTKALEMLNKSLGVTPEDNDMAEFVRVGAEEARKSILSFFDRTWPENEAIKIAHAREAKQVTIEHQPASE